MQAQTGAEPALFPHKNLILTAVFVAFLNGVAAWFVIPREEDPAVPRRHGMVAVAFPGATPRDMERFIARPVEEELSRVQGIRNLETTMRADVLTTRIRLRDDLSSVSRIDQAWREVQEALDRAQKKFPEAASPPDLNRDLGDQEAIVLAIVGQEDPLVLLDQSRVLKESLEGIPGVKKVETAASPGEQLSVLFDNGLLAKHGVSLGNLVRQLRGGNAAVPAGYLRLGNRRVNVLTNSFYQSAEELARFPVILKSGGVVPLGSISRISRTPSLPETELMTFNGKRALGLGVIPRRGIDLQGWGEDVRAAVKDFVSSEPVRRRGLRVEEVAYQPRHVKERILDIIKEMGEAVVLVTATLLFMLGLRVGLIVALQVPVVTIIAFGLFARMGGTLNQISFVSFIIAIGLLVDNVIVIVDGIRDKMEQGRGPLEAVAMTRKEYAMPLLAGTGTTIASFIPMLLATGETADFTRAVGLIALLAMGTSYLFCMFATPVLTAPFIRNVRARPWGFVSSAGAAIGGWVHRAPKTLLAAAAAVVLASFWGARFVKVKFFPLADRETVIVDLHLPEGTHLSETIRRLRAIEEEVLRDPRVLTVTALAGRGVPFFYYNLPVELKAPHIAQFIVGFRTMADAKAFKSERESPLQALVPEGSLIIKELAQGPCVNSPIDVRVLSRDPERLEEAARKVLGVVRGLSETRNVRSTMGVGMMNLRLDVNDSAAGNFGVTRAEVSSVVLGNTRGIPITTFRGADDPYSITLLSKRSDDPAVADVESAYIGNAQTGDLTVKTLTARKVEFSASIIEHWNRRPVVRILAEISPGVTEGAATAAVDRALRKSGPFQGAEVEIGGIGAEASYGYDAMSKAMPMGILVFLAFLLYQFNSYRRIAVILATVPLCVVGVVPGLLLSGSSFGFMTLLSVYILAGTAVNNGIFLVDFMDQRIREGASMDQAVTEGIQRRMRPIMLTSVASMIQLVPLTTTHSSLWPSFAWAGIAGLGMSTVLTLVVVPALYKLAFERKARATPRTAIGAGLLVFAALLIPSSSRSEGRDPSVSTMTLEEVLSRSRLAHEASAALQEAEGVEWASRAVRRASRWPQLTVQGSYERRDRETRVALPAVTLPVVGTVSPGKLDAMSRDGRAGALELRQPLWDLSGMVFNVRAWESTARAARLEAFQKVKDAQVRAIEHCLQALELRAGRLALEDYIDNLEVRYREIRRLYELGGVSEIELLKVKLGMEDARQKVRELKEEESFLGTVIANSTGKKGSVSPADLMDRIPGEPSLPSSGMRTEREDIKAIDMRVKAAEWRMKAARTSTLPSFEAFARDAWFSQEFLDQDRWRSAGLRARWPIFDGGIRRSQAAAAAAEMGAWNDRKRAAIEEAEAQMSHAAAALDLKRLEYEERLRAVSEARSVSDIEFKRLRQGKTTVNNLVDAEDMLKERREKASLSKILWYREWFRYLIAAGMELRAPE